MSPHRAAAALLVAAFLAGGCGKAKAPQVDAATEKAQAHERARKDAFGTQVQALDTAKGLQDDINKKATENIDRVDATAR